MSLTDAPFVGRVWSAVRSAAYAAAPPDQDVIVPADCSGVVVTLDVTAVSSSTVSVVLQGMDETSGKAWTIATIAALSVQGTVSCRVHPSSPTAAVSGGLQTQQGQLPQRVRVHVVQTGTSATYSVGVNFTK